jgi:DNA-binding CsgD family transcriptional regulator
MPPSPSDPPCAPPAPAEPLTARELEVLAVLATGATSPEIADRLGIALATVKTHLHHAYRKMGVTNRVAATRSYLAARAESTAMTSDRSTDPPRADPAREPFRALDIGERISEVEGLAAAADHLRRRLEALRCTAPR